MKNHRNLIRRLTALVLITGAVIFYFRACRPERLPEKTEEQERLAPPAPAATKTVVESAKPAPELQVRRKELPDAATLHELRSGVKLNLSTIYSAQKAFFSDYKRYSTDLIYVGWAPNVAKMNFKLGFLQPFRPKTLSTSDGTEEDPSRLDSDEFLQTPFADSGDRFHYSKAAEAISLFDYEKFCRQQCTANSKGFEVLVVLPLGESGRVDVWSISDKKELRQLWDGVAQKALE